MGVNIKQLAVVIPHIDWTTTTDATATKLAPPSVVDGQWSSWSMWGDCSQPCGRGDQYRRRHCDSPPPSNAGLDCVGVDRERRVCDCDPNFNASAACCRCTDVSNMVGYMVDQCDCSRYYMCEKYPTGCRAIHMKCPKCVLWNQKQLTCGIRIPSCVDHTEITTTAPSRCHLKEVVGKNQTFSLGGSIFECAPGTVFSLSNCGCIASGIRPPVERTKTITCIDFETGFKASKGIYIHSINVAIRKNTEFHHAAYFNGASATLEVPGFANAYSTYRQFTMSFWYKRTAGRSSLQGLFSNGDCETDPSILITSQPDSIGVKLITKSHSISKDDIPSPGGQWHHIVVSYTGSSAAVYVNDVKTSLGTIRGAFLEKHSPLVIGHTNARGAEYFKGYMDEICFFAQGLTAEELSKGAFT